MISKFAIKRVEDKEQYKILKYNPKQIEQSMYKNNLLQYCSRHIC